MISQESRLGPPTTDQGKPNVRGADMELQHVRQGRSLSYTVLRLRAPERFGGQGGKAKSQSYKRVETYL